MAKAPLRVAPDTAMAAEAGIFAAAFGLYLLLGF
jgi:hypothetical protein